MGDGADGNSKPGEQQYRATISIAVPGSIIDNTQSLERATAVAGQIARAAVIFRVHEIVVFDDWDSADGNSHGPRGWRGERFSGSGGSFLARVLQYLDTPQYLRRALIPLTPDLRLAGLLPPLDAPHHARMHEWPEFREGVVVAEEGGEGGAGGSSVVDVGLQQRVHVRGSFSEGTRLTVAMGPASEREKVFLPGVLLSPVSPLAPWACKGLYWGYSVRLARGVSGALKDCPFSGAAGGGEGGGGEGGAAGGGAYDLIIGTSEHGEVKEIGQFKFPPFRHALIVFGGVAGLEESCELDEGLEEGRREPQQLCHYYLNTCSLQGSRTIRTEEAVLISLAHILALIK
ncbi:hypothetical protein CLOM_g20980 [Closterium sp. NIES-68]|nr:hypothetical protein CLOM_g20980 [Closterium sp. NIES-68]GJP59954.1 hypothetical protein CLOP_g16936 [Closterium sp. NIES-67]